VGLSAIELRDDGGVAGVEDREPDRLADQAGIADLDRLVAGAEAELKGREEPGKSVDGPDAVGMERQPLLPRLGKEDGEARGLAEPRGEVVERGAVEIERSGGRVRQPLSRAVRVEGG